MNLYDMVRRNDKNIELVASVVDSNSFIEKNMGANSNVFEDRIARSKRRVDGILYRGFDIAANPSVMVKLKTPLLFYPFSEYFELTGWSVMSLDSDSVGNTFELRLVNRKNKITVSKSSVVLTSQLSPIIFPYPFGCEIDRDSIDLHMSVSQETKGRLFLVVHKVLERSEVINLCRGTGVEIGPGLNPQIKPNSGTNITYIEQSSPEEWDILYNDTGTRPVNQELWANYKIGEAKYLPFDDKSLDFIFSSHVFEHLANPIAYLEYWKSKLKKGGIIAGIVPDIAGCKDYVYEPCALSNLIQEYEAGYMDPQLHHYEKWAKYRAPIGSPIDFFNKGRSIHAHYYTARNMSMLLDYAVNNLGFGWFNIHHTPNHKDFYFLVCAE